VQTRLDHVRANVADRPRAVDWYTNVLGFEVESFWPPDRPNYAHFTSHGGATFAIEAFDTPYGTRKFTIADLDGNELGFVRDRAT
jgi:catechol 2,3-dioxygenase-like lactoylglutathione lyase family enzyme